MELQKSTLATMMAMSFSHFLSCLSEVLSFFICIFLLRHWLQFDLFRDALWASEAAVFHHALPPGGATINNNKMHTIPASLKSKRFWKRKNRSRSPSRSVGRSGTSECFTSSEDDISSISIDDVSSDISESESIQSDHQVYDEIDQSANGGVAEIDQSVTSDLVKLTENETEDSFHSNEQIDDSDQDSKILLNSSSEDLSQVSSLDSQLSWFQDHYLETSECRYYSYTHIITYIRTKEMKQLDTVAYYRWHHCCSDNQMK